MKYTALYTALFLGVALSAQADGGDGAQLDVTSVYYKMDAPNTIIAHVDDVDMGSHDITGRQTLFDSLDDETISALAEDISWRRLLLFLDNKSKSTMPDDTFFLAATGRTSPKDELIANLTELKKDPDAYVCRYPARVHWLGEKLGVSMPECPEVRAWMDALDVQKMSLIHAEEHINRIGSSFAHTLIRMDTGASLASGNTGLAYSLNFASLENPPKGVNTPLDALRGTSRAALTIENYETKQNKYLLRDGRDIWQYDIDFTQDELKQILRHVWEIKHSVRYYRFLGNNCATEVMRFIDLVRPNLSLLAQGGRVVSPQEAAQRIAAAGVLSDSVYVPSLKTRHQAHINAAHQRREFYEDLLLPSDNNPVDAGTKSHRAMMYVGQQAGEHFVGLSLRGAHQDLLDRPQGKRDYLSMQIMGLDVRYDGADNALKLEDFTVIDLLALNPIGSSYAGKSWGGHLKAARISDATNGHDDKHLVAALGGAYGHSVTFGRRQVNSGELPNTLCYVLATTDLQLGRIRKGVRMGLGARLGCVYHASSQLRLTADAKLTYWYHANDARYFQPKLKLAIQYDLNQDNALRFEHTWQQNNGSDDRSWRAAYVRYF